MKRYLSLIIACLLLMNSQAQAGWVTLPGSNPIAVKVTSFKERHFLATIRQQYDYSCGSAALATLLSYQYQDPVSEQEVFKVMWQHGDQQKIRREGFSLLDIKQYLVSNGYSADGYEATLDKLAQVGIPAIALIRDNGYNHFVVIKGVNKNQVAIGDPSLGARIIPREQFEKMRLNPILFVINKARTELVFNAARDWHVREKAPLGLAVSPDSLTNITLLRPGPNAF